MPAEGTDHRPCCGVSLRQAQVDDLPTLRCYRDLDAQLVSEGLRPGATSNHNGPG